MTLGESRTAKALLLEPLMRNPEVEAMCRAVDDYIEQSIEDESLRNTELGFKYGLEEMTQRLHISLLNELQQGRNLEILDRLFGQVAMDNKLSSHTFMGTVKGALKESKVEELKAQLATLQS